MPAARSIRQGRQLAVRILVGAAALAAVLVALRHLPGQSSRVADAIAGLGSVAAIALPAVYVPWMVLGIPTAPLALAAGFTLGPLAGGLVAGGGCTAGALAAFLVARWLAHGPVERLAARYPAIAPVRKAIHDRGFRLILLLRLAPVMPVPFLNHVLGVTSVSPGTYALATLLGTMPSAFLAASVGALLRGAAERVDVSALRLEGGSLAAALLASAALGALAVRVLARELSKESSY